MSVPSGTCCARDRADARSLIEDRLLRLIGNEFGRVGFMDAPPEAGDGTEPGHEA